MKCRVRVGFYLHFDSTTVYEPGTILDLTEEEFSRFAHQLELVEEEPIEEEHLDKPKELKRAKVQG